MDTEEIREIWDRIVEEESEKDTAWDMVRIRASEEVADAYQSDLAAAREQIKALEAGFAKKQMTCGHPVAAIVCAEEGTHHCGWCEDLAAAREQLAEMREALGLHEQLRDLAYESGYYAGRMEQAAASFAVPDYDDVLTSTIERRNAISKKMDKALSAAPAGGRVLFSGEARTEHFGGAYDDSQGTSFHIPGWIGKDDTIVALRVTEAPPKQPEDDDWPRECPRCGAAGGSELGPCPMCKGTGFVDQE